MTAWLTAGKTWLIGAAAGIALAAAVLWRVFTAGRRAERTAQNEQSLKNYQTREAIHEDVSSRPVDTRRDDLARWVRE